MKRRTFITSFALTGITVMSMPHLAFTEQTYPEAILIGKGTPKLYGTDGKIIKDTYTAFLNMRSAALQDQIDIKIVSGYRSFYRQKSIWEKKYKKYTAEGLSPLAAIQKIIAYSTIPGTSRHHWGTDIDIIDANASYTGNVLVPEKFSEGRRFHKLKKWMDIHANTYGFYRVYTNNPHRKGFKYEPWHYSYAPVAKPMLKAYRKLDIKKILLQESLLGSTHFSDAFIDQYYNANILDIHPYLL